MAFIEIKNLNKTYGKGEAEVKALKNINLIIEEGQFVAIVGPSGSGKSTLLHLLGGVDKPSSGEIILNGTNMYSLKEKELSILRRRKIGFVFQFFNLIPVLTAEENIEMPVLLDGGKIDSEYKKELLKILGLEDRKNHHPAELSGGQQQRVSIGRALANKPSLILADEPTGNLDSKNSKEILELLRYSAKKYNQTLVLITNGYTLLNELEDNKEYYVSVSTVDRNNKIDTIYEKADNLNINRDNVSLNNKILTMHGEGSNDSFNFVIKGIVIFVFLLIITATIFLIYNAINISVAERIKQFGILRSIGSAPKQIRNLVLRDRDPFSDDYNYELSIIVNKDNFFRFNNHSWQNIDAGFKYPDLNDEKQIKEISSQMQDIADEYGITFFDTLGENRRSNEMWTVINVFIYGFIVIVTMIGVVNVFNTITLNILLKKKEYGTLETIGMDKGQLNKMVILEGMLHGVISSIVGGILAVILSNIASRIINYGFSFSNNIYLAPFIIGFAAGVRNRIYFEAGRF